MQKKSSKHPFLGCSRPEIPNGKVSELNPQETFRNTQLMRFSCNTGYRPKPDSALVRCVDNRWIDFLDSWNGTETFPACILGKLFVADIKYFYLVKC